MAYLQVAIGITVRDGHILVARRAAGDGFAEEWEFPGGKLLPEEGAADCMHREMAEELNVSVSVVGRLAPVAHDYGDVKVMLHPFVVILDGGEPQSQDGQELRWVSLDEMMQMRFMAANAPVLGQLQSVLRSLALL